MIGKIDEAINKGKGNDKNDSDEEAEKPLVESEPVSVE
jgi:hypothetical protein